MYYVVTVYYGFEHYQKETKSFKLDELDLANAYYDEWVEKKPVAIVMDKVEEIKGWSYIRDNG